MKTTTFFLALKTQRWERWLMSLLRKWTAILGRVFLLKMKSEGSSLAFEEEAAEGEEGVLDNKFQENLLL